MKRKVLVVASTFPRWENDTLPPFVYELSKRLTEEFDIYVLAPHYPDSKTDEVMDNMKVHRFRYFFNKYEKLAGSGGILPTLKSNKWFFFQVPFFLLGELLTLKKIIKAEHPDIIHAHWIIPQGLVVYLNNKLSRKKNKVSYVVTSHGSDIFGLKGFNSLKKSILKNAYKITVVSNAIKKEVLETIDKDLEIEVIPMGVDTNLFNPNKKDSKLKKKYKINGPLLLFVGRLAPEKGVRYLIQAMPEVIKNFPKTKLLIIGEGTLKEELHELTKKFNLESNIIFLGWINNKDLPKYYATADVFVCPSLREGSPVSYIEALSCGTSIVVGDIPISRELVENNKGLVVKQDDPKDISDNILKILNKKNTERNKISQFIKRNYDNDIINKKFVNILR